MKRTFFSLVIATLAFHASAQKPTAKKPAQRMTFGIQAGANATKFTGKSYDGTKLDHDFILGYHVGVNFEIPIASNLCIQAGIRYIMKGTQNSEPVVSGGNSTSKLKVYYSEVPLYFLYKPPAGKGRLLFGIGGAIAYGTGGTYSYDETGSQFDEDGKVKFKKSYKFSDPNPDNHIYLKPLDASVGVLVGYQFGEHASVQLNGNYGLLNIVPKIEDIPDDQENVRPVSFGITLGYRFGRKK